MQCPRPPEWRAQAQSSCQPVSLSFKLDSAYILKTVHPWPASADPAELKPVYADPSFRQAIRDTLAKPDPGRVFNGRWDCMDVTTVAKPENAHLEGRSIGDIAAEQGRDPVDVFLDLGLAEDLGTLFTGRILNLEEEPVAELLKNDGTLISLSDAGAHNTFLCDAGYAMYFLGRWVRELGAFDLPTAIRKLTSDQADVYGILDRGRLTPGAWADMILFDPDTVHITPLERRRDLPAGAERLVRRAPGLLGTWVNGVRVFDGTDYVQVTPPGQVLRRFRAGLPSLALPQAARAAE